jgi:hypothetical protein
VAEPLVVTLTVDAVATGVTLWQSGSRRFEERIVHGVLALAASDAPDAEARRAVRFDAVAALLAGFGEDAARPDAFVALGAGAGQPGVYAAAETDETPAADGVALVHALSARAGVPGYVVEPLGGADAHAAGVCDAERALLVRTALRRDTAERTTAALTEPAPRADGGPDAMAVDAAECIVVLAEPRPLICACRGDVIVASREPACELPQSPDATYLLRRAEQGDAAAAETLDACVTAIARSVSASATRLTRIEAVLLAGSLAMHAAFAQPLAAALRAFAPVRVRPGARVDRALADAVLAVLRGEEPVCHYA